MMGRVRSAVPSEEGGWEEGWDGRGAPILICLSLPRRQHSFYF